ncbi:MAG: hypothetical protein Fur007_01280 [Rhodoferax sp.]
MRQTLAQAMAGFTPALPLGVAFSGGADSTALLAACVQRWPSMVVALHVHHGLQPAADDFEAHVRATCARLGVALRVARVDARALHGESPEAAARSARYRALALLAQASDTPGPVQDIALAHHADDQLETLLLALTRGGGLPGLSAMPACQLRDGLRYHRPLLQVPGAALRDAASVLGFVRDPSNTDERFARNRLRAQVLPALRAAFPQAVVTFSRSARHAAQAQKLLRELAQEDLARLGQPPHLVLLQKLSPERQANVLRHWLRQSHQTTPSTAQMDALLSQIRACRTRGHRIDLKVGAGHCVRRGPVLDWQSDADARPPPLSAQAPTDARGVDVVDAQLQKSTKVMP